jgi:hypothetical protein
MADKIKLDEGIGYTEFENSPTRGGSFYQPTGPLGRFFAKFFATKAQKEIAKKAEDSIPTPETGDTIVSTEVIKDVNVDQAPALGGVNRNPMLPQLEFNRRHRYREYEEMDQYPEIGAAFDIYADDSTQKDPRNNKFAVKSDSALVVNEVEELFDAIDLDRFMWDIVRNTVKYGDCFIELILDVNRPSEGLKKMKILNPNWILRVENEFGHLKKFLQEIPNNETMNYSNSPIGQKPVKYIELDKNQIVHFRLHTSDPLFYPYGKSIAALCHRTFRSLKMMEDAMMIYRMSRAPERRIFYVDTGNLPTSKAEMFMERLKEKFKKEKFYNGVKGTVDARYNPMSMDEDFFVPTKNGRGTKIDTLPGATNLGEIEDVRYFRDKLLAALKVPKDYLVEKDKSPERKANLSQLDVKFARTIHRVQQNIELGLTAIVKRHLELKKFPASVVRAVKITLPEPSDMSAKRKLDLDAQKLNVIQQAMGLGLFSKKEIMKQYYDFDNSEVDRILKEKKEEEATEGADQQADQSQAPPPAPQGQEPAENTPPTANESFEASVDKLKGLISISEEDSKVLDRIIKKQQRKADTSLNEQHI